ncbi:MAG: hypothetical protein HYR66_08490 [Sphingobacteriales bacterium]|nr:hypothetical protein [Sphingobacteriales bacterium]MBI3719131.1 hypothetical protein [Sphingobacteriales bacterium]
MKWIVLIVLLMLLTAFAKDKALYKPLSKGSLSFKLNGKLYIADSSHARGYVNKQTMQAYINGANSEDMVMGIEFNGVNAKGTFTLTNTNGKVDFTIQHKTYTIAKPGDYLKVTITNIKQQGSFLLLDGSFEGSLQDKLGTKVLITEGKFETSTL